MNKGTFLIALILLSASGQAVAHQCQVQEGGQSQRAARVTELRKAFDLLIRTGVLKANEEGVLNVDQSVVEKLRRAGIIESDKSDVSAVCIDPGL